MLFSSLAHSKKPGRFNNKCVQLIGQFYPELKVLSIGGGDVDERGLLALGEEKVLGCAYQFLSGNTILTFLILFFFCGFHIFIAKIVVFPWYICCIFILW